MSIKLHDFDLCQFHFNAFSYEFLEAEKGIYAMFWATSSCNIVAVRLKFELHDHSCECNVM
jgi:hypothetical protein